MIHIYCGNGKGKSTASLGLCVRAAGNDIPVLLVQFLKDDTSGELNILRNIPKIEIMHSDKFFGFTWNMTEAELKEQAEIFDGMLGKVETWIDENLGKLDTKKQSEQKGNDCLSDMNGGLSDEQDADKICCLPDECEIAKNSCLSDKPEADKNSCIKLLVILDEVIPAIDCKLVEESVLFKLMDKYSRDDVEFVLTGRNPSEELKSKADYISCIEAVKHPYENGVTARQGVEY